MKFELTPSQVLLYKTWEKEHSHVTETAIGGDYTFKFTPTSNGTIVKVTCYCGKTIDLSDYVLW